MWEASRSLLTDLATLRQDLQAMIERERKTHGDPGTETRAWATKLTEFERKRDKYQEMFAVEAMTLDELKAKLETLKQTREIAEKELASSVGKREGLEAIERDRDLILESYATLAPEALDAFPPRNAARCTLYLISPSSLWRAEV